MLAEAGDEETALSSLCTIMNASSNHTTTNTTATTTESKSECKENRLGQVIVLVRGAESWRNDEAALCGRDSMGRRLLVLTAMIH